jgi:hypothetical protein
MVSVSAVGATGAAIWAKAAWQSKKGKKDKQGYKRFISDKIKPTKTKGKAVPVAD